MIRSMTQGIMIKNVGPDPLPRLAAPPVIAPINYDSVDREQTEINVLRVENQEQRRLLESQAREHQQFKDEINTTITDLLQDQQTNKQAISFLYDKFKEASAVAFSTGYCDVHGKKLPIPAGFEKQHCKFFTSGQGKHHGSGTGDVVPIFQTGDSMVLPYSGICDLPGGIYGVWAAKPVISEQEVVAKKIEYKLMP